MIRGVDVSSYQPKPRWADIKKAGAEFAIVKVTEGNGYVNPHRAEQVHGAIAEGILVCLYHFAEPNGPDWVADAAQEGKRLDDVADSFEQEYGKSFFCFLDVERNEPLSDAEKVNWRAWCNEFRLWCSDGGRPVGMYSYKPFLEALKLEPSWSATLLWLARYPTVFRPAADYGSWPIAIDPWFRADIWQDGGDANGATWPGIDGKADVDCFAGSLAELEELIDAAR